MANEIAFLRDCLKAALLTTSCNCLMILGWMLVTFDDYLVWDYIKEFQNYSQLFLVAFGQFFLFLMMLREQYWVGRLHQLIEDRPKT
ncbi:hypothetical protein KBD34_03700 [Patescibacteria group bacterium]|nr:hypothetical protein [Patescibacteria group bacterium]